MKTHYRILATVAVLLAGVVQALANVTVTPASVSISADKAANSPTTGWTTLGTIKIAEPNSSKNDFAVGTNITLVLKCPAGFLYNTGAVPTLTVAGNITVATAAVNN